jgi:hypothetical protein
MWRTSQPKFWPKKLVTSVQIRKNVASTVSRVTVRLSLFVFALKYVLVSAVRSSAWRWNSPVTWARWSPMSRMYSREPCVSPGTWWIASLAAANWSRWVTIRRSIVWTSCLIR